MSLRQVRKPHMKNSVVTIAIAPPWLCSLAGALAICDREMEIAMC
jgi:hypothetical protein